MARRWLALTDCRCYSFHLLFGAAEIERQIFALGFDLFHGTRDLDTQHTRGFVFPREDLRPAATGLAVSLGSVPVSPVGNKDGVRVLATQGMGKGFPRN